jgi:tRNA (cmo5U34)-methyltransferase
LENVKEHFEEEAEEFDNTILKLIPLYNEMIDSMISTIPFEYSDHFKVLDLGCGTGNVSQALKEKFPNAKISCLDIAKNMIEMAKIKLASYKGINYIVGDFSEYDFETKYNVVVSSLALHHVKTDEDKKDLYSKIFGLLLDDGIFLNSDVVLGSNESLNKIYREKWIEYMLKNVPKKEVEEKWLPKQKEEDFPAPLIHHIKWLKETGFKNCDIVWKYYGLAVYCGTRL